MRWMLLGCLTAGVFFGCDDGGSDDEPQPEADAAAEADGGVDTPDATSETPDAEATAPDAEPPLDDVDYWAPGAYNVGFLNDEVSYTPPRTVEPRTLRAVAWYPTEAEEGDPTRYARLISADGVLTDAPPSIPVGAPTLVFSHGNGGLAEQNYFQAEFLASHGWVVIAFDHTGNTFNDMGLEIYQLFELRPMDVSAVIDHFTDLPGDHPLADVVEEEVMMAGHSFGGYTALAVAGAGFDVDALVAGCAQLGEGFCDYIDEAAEDFRAGFEEPRIKAVIPMTPFGASVFEARVADIDIPMLMMTGGMDATLPDAQEGDPLWAAMDGPDAIRLSFPEGGHFTFSSACELPFGIGENDGCGEQFIPFADAHVIINAFTLAFGRLHMLGDEKAAPLLAGEGLPEGAPVELFTTP